VGNSLADQTKQSFAVGMFDSWLPLREALGDARHRGLDFDSFSCLALERLFVDKTIVVPGQGPLVIEPLPFPDKAVLIACTSGQPIACCEGFVQEHPA
jgi:hypothetical protein